VPYTVVERPSCYDSLITASLLLLHQVKKKMEEAEFCRNLRGVNAGQDFPKPFLSAIYHSICSCELAAAQCSHLLYTQHAVALSTRTCTDDHSVLCRQHADGRAMQSCARHSVHAQRSCTYLHSRAGLRHVAPSMNACNMPVELIMLP
jgi:hypothetical protein